MLEKQGKIVIQKIIVRTLHISKAGVEIHRGK